MSVLTLKKKKSVLDFTRKIDGGDTLMHCMSE